MPENIIQIDQNLLETRLDRPAGGIAGRGIGCVHADRSPLPEGVPAVGPMMGKERG